MEPIGVYLYGFVPRATWTTLNLDDVKGVEGSGPVRIIDLGGVAAIVADVPIEAFKAGLDDGPDPSWLIPRALGHEHVLGTILARSAVLPARFGSLFSSVETLATLATGHLTAIEQFFETVRDHREWSLRGYVAPEAAAARLLESDPDLAGRRARLPDAPGARYFQEKKLHEAARLAARRAYSAEVSEVRRAIRVVAVDARSLPLRAPEGPEREMVLHEAALIPRGREAEALAAAEHASTSTGGLLTLEPSGPWPPFHFCPDLGAPPS